MSSDYKANTMMTQADKLTPQNAVAKLGETTNQLRSAGPYQTQIYKPGYQPINRGIANMPPSVQDPYSDAGLQFLYGQMMNQYAPAPPGQPNPATFTNNPPVAYRPPPLNNLTLNTPIADASKPATPAAEGNGIVGRFAPAVAAAVSGERAGGLMAINRKKYKRG